jgi:hypothetical protein
VLYELTLKQEELMSWPNTVIGIIRHDELLNALLAIWKTRYNAATRNDLNEVSEIYEIGFEEGLDAIAQIAGLSEEFDSGKALHRSKIKRKYLNTKFSLQPE